MIAAADSISEASAVSRAIGPSTDSGVQPSPRRSDGTERPGSATVRPSADTTPSVTLLTLALAVAGTTVWIGGCPGSRRSISTIELKLSVTLPVTGGNEE